MSKRASYTLQVLKNTLQMKIAQITFIENEKEKEKISEYLFIFKNRIFQHL